MHKDFVAKIYITSHKKTPTLCFLLVPDQTLVYFSNLTSPFFVTRRYIKDKKNYIFESGSG
jgi:hypothetical protein